MSFRTIALVVVAAFAGCTARTADDDDGARSDHEMAAVDAGADADAAADTCSPALAAGVVNRFERALHDAIAWAEGTRGVADDGYNVSFGPQFFTSCAAHPRHVFCEGHLCSDAAGRYQYLSTTWVNVGPAVGATDFSPGSQERAAQYTITQERRVTVHPDRALTATEFSNAMSKLSYEWASLPPGRYGQPTRTESQMWGNYKANVAAGAGASASAGADEVATSLRPTLSADALVGALDSPAPGEAVSAADELANRGYVPAIVRLLAMDPATRPDIAPTAILVLARLGRAAPTDATKQSVARRLVDLLAREKGRASPDAPGNVLLLIEALGTLEHPLGAAALERELFDAYYDPAGRGAIVAALGRIGQPSSLAALQSFRSTRSHIRATELDQAVDDELESAIASACARLPTR